MRSSIEFYSEEDLAKFLAVFCTSSTAVFEVKPFGNGGYKLTFTGGF